MTSRPNIMLVVLVAVVVAGCFRSNSALAARTNIVTLSGTSFTPSSLTNFVGDIVTWTNVSGTHNITWQSADPVCGDRTTASSPWNFSCTNNTAGVRTYRCTVHSSSFASGMVATITTLPLPALTNGVVTNGSQFLFTILKSMPRQTNIIQYSTNLTNWFAVGTNSANVSSFSFTNLFSADPFRFYRVIQP